MTHVSLFSGIGGIDLAAHWAGFKTIQFVERDPFCQKILAKHFPDIPIHDDITTFDAILFRGRVDLLSGGFPCQPFSVAGKQRSKEDDRYLWPEMLRVITQARPTWVVGENVPGIISLALDDCLLSLEAEGYATRTLVLPASGVGACHRRYRVFIIAHSQEQPSNDGNTEPRPETRTEFRNSDSQGATTFTKREGLEGDWPEGPTSNQNASNSISCGLSRKPRGWAGAFTQNGYAQLQQGDWRDWGVKPVIRRGDDGFPGRVDRLRSLGNAVVPQQVFPILEGIAKELRKEVAA